MGWSPCSSLSFSWASTASGSAFFSRSEDALDHQGLGGVASPVGVQDLLGHAPDLVDVQQAHGPQLLDVSGVEGPDLLLPGVGGREDLLNAVDAGPLLQGEDHDEVGDVDAVVFPLLRGGHDLQPDVVVDGGGGHGLVVLHVLHGNEVQVLTQQGDDLVHVQADVRQLLPGGQPVVVQVVLPPQELVGGEVPVVAHSIALFLVFHIRRTFSYYTIA